MIIKVGCCGPMLITMVFVCGMVRSSAVGLIAVWPTMILPGGARFKAKRPAHLDAWTHNR